MDLELARRQHADLVAAVRGLNIDVLELPPDETNALSVFTQDLAVVVNGIALMCRPVNSTRNNPLRRQCAIQSSTSIDTGSLTNEGCSSNSNIFRLQNTISIESVEGHAGRRRPRSLIHQSAGSLQGFSLFGSVDSEQSVPRTAPLATPDPIDPGLQR